MRNPFKPHPLVSLYDPAIDTTKLTEEIRAAYLKSWDIKTLPLKAGMAATVFTVGDIVPSHWMLIAGLSLTSMQKQNLIQACVHEYVTPDGERHTAVTEVSNTGTGQRVAPNAWFDEMFDDVGQEVILDIADMITTVFRLPASARPR